MTQFRRVILEAWCNLIIMAVLCTVGFCALVNEAAVTAFGETHRTYRGAGGDEKAAAILCVAEKRETWHAALQALQERNARVTFIVSGSLAAENSDLAAQTLQHGHELMTGFSPVREEDEKQQRAALSQENRLVRKAAGRKPAFCCLLKQDEKAEKVVYACGQDAVLPTTDTLDRYDGNPEKIAERARRNLDNGVFLLMHANERFPDNLNAVLAVFSEEGFSVATVAQLTAQSRA